jgi:hypothetical protein
MYVEDLNRLSTYYDIDTIASTYLMCTGVFCSLDDLCSEVRQQIVKAKPNQLAQLHCMHSNDDYNKPHLTHSFVIHGAIKKIIFQFYC